MPDITGTSRAQTTFLRAFRVNPSGPPSCDWPSPAILRRWLRRPRFRAALDAVQLAIRFQTDFHISSAATAAARAIDDGASAPNARQVADILRLSHLRQRFNATQPDPPKLKTPREHMLTIPSQHRLTKDEFHQLALSRGYAPHLEQIPEFPPPTTQDTFYYNLLKDVHALLWWMQLYTKHTQDQRYAHLLNLCKEIIPRHILRYPQFSSAQPTTGSQP